MRHSLLRGAKSRRRASALGPRPLHGRLLSTARLPGDRGSGEGGPGGGHDGQVRQQRVQQQEAQTPDHVHQRSAGGAGEGVPEDALPGRVRAGAAGHEDGVDGGQSSGDPGVRLESHHVRGRREKMK